MRNFLVTATQTTQSGTRPVLQYYETLEKASLEAENLAIIKDIKDVHVWERKGAPVLKQIVEWEKA